MPEKQIPLNAIPVLHALARSYGPASFAQIKEESQLSQATVNRILNQLCEFGYAIKAGRGKYVAGPELVDMGLAVTSNQILPRFKPVLGALRRRTHLNSELYMIAAGGPIFLTHSPARGEAVVPFQYGHIVGNRVAHPAGLFYAAIHEHETPEGSRENFIVDRGRQWPELFRAASMIPGSNYCLAVSGMLTNVGEERHEEIRQALQKACAAAEDRDFRPATVTQAMQVIYGAQSPAVCSVAENGQDKN